MVWFSGLDIVSQNERSPVRFLVRAHGWVADQVTDLFLSNTDVSLSFSLPSPLKINQ